MAQGAADVSNPSPVAAPTNFARTLVSEVFSESSTLAAQTQATALAAISALGNFSLTIPSLTVPSIPVQEVTAQPLGTPPAEPGDLVPSYPTAPTAPALGGTVSVDIGDEPVFDVDRPLLLDIPIPDPLALQLPTAPSITEVAIPLSPDFVLPEVPTMLSLNIPDAPTLNIPDFTDVAPVAPTAPDANFSYAEEAYTTPLLTLLNTRMLDLCNGMSTGMPPGVEDAIWQRNRDRTQKLTERAVAEAARITAGRGFSMPQGTQVRVVQQAIAEAMAKDGEDSRAVMIAQAELEQKNFQFSLTTAITLEGALIQHFDQVKNRALDAAKFAFRAVIDIFMARVQLYQADVQAFSVKAQVFRVRLEAALAQLEIFKAQIEAQKAIAQINESMVKVYVAQIEGVRAAVDIFKAQVEAAKAQVEAQQARVNIFKAECDAYDSAVKGQVGLYQMYGERVKAEMTKVQAYSEEVKAFSSRTDAFASLVKARLGVAELQFKQEQEIPLEVFKAQMQAYAVGVSAEGDRLKSLAQMFLARVQAFGEGERAKAAYTTAQVEAVKATTAVYTSQAQLSLQAGEIFIRASVSAAETAQASLRAAGQLSGQLASAALAARNASASVSDGVSNSASNSTSLSVSRSKSDSDSYSDIHTHQE